MNPLIQLKTTPPLLITLVLLCFGLLPTTQAVVPAPDGGYPNFTTAEGQNALQSLTIGAANTAVGWFSLKSVTAGSFNTAIGAGTLVLNTGDNNTATGAVALLSNTTGGFNTANGYQALLNNTTGSANVALGSRAGYNVTTASNVICIGAFGDNTDNTCFIGGIFDQTSSGTAVFIDQTGKLGTTTSSRRFKEEIKPMDKTSQVLLALKPVTFRYKKEIDPAGMQQFGLVAEEVEKVNPALVVRDKEGKPYSVRYEQVNAMLLNEFLKEHQTVQELKSAAVKQEATIANQQKQIEALTAGLQKVSAQMEANKPVDRTVMN